MTGTDVRVGSYRQLLNQQTLSSFIKNEQLQEFVNTVVGHSFRVLLIDSHDFERLEQENRLIVDCDFCEF